MERRDFPAGPGFEAKVHDPNDGPSENEKSWDKTVDPFTETDDEVHDEDDDLGIDPEDDDEDEFEEGLLGEGDDD